MTITSVHDGSSDKFYRAWADSADGSKGFSTTDSSKEYFGVYAGTTPPANYKAYSWTKIKGEAGRSVVNTEMEYAINDSKTTPPTSGWSLETPVWKTGLYIWQRVKVSYSTGDPSYTTPHCLESNIIEDVTGNIGDWIFRDKTEVLSGTEIFTDKADEEALVHVEVDGKSYQSETGDNISVNGNFANDLENWSVNGTAAIDNIDGMKVIKLQGTNAGFYQYSSKQIPGYYEISFKAKSVGTSSAVMYGFLNKGIKATKNQLITGNWQTYSYRTEIEIGAAREYYHFYATANTNEGVYITDINVRPLGPTPYNPIEIHSLNNVDVVSSVGKRNLILNSKDLGIHARTGTDEKLDEFLGVKNVIKITNPTSGMYINPPQIMSESTILGESYTLSVLFTYRGNKGSMPRLYLGPGSYITAKGDIEEGKFTRIYITSENVKTDITRIHMHMDGFDEVYLADWKIEKGTANTPYSPASEDILESDNHPLIDKTNLLLDEPLRSVGDVKDRLFRDTDGLWKIERNVGRIIFDGTQRFSIRQNANTEWSSYLYTDSDIAVKAEIITSHYQNQYHMTSYPNREGQQVSNYTDTSASVIFTDNPMSTTEWKNKLINSPITLLYEKKERLIENLGQELQDKLNNLRSFKDSNYIYTVLPDKSNILSEKLKPTLHATFKSIAWANDFRYKFEQSKAMHATDIWFAKGVSNTIAPNIGWSTDAPVWEDGLYIWSKTITTYGNGRTEETNPVCITGATGRSVDKIEEWYYLSNKPDVLEGGTWSKTPPTWKDGKYIWTKNKIIYKNPSGSEETSPINTTGGSGQKGDSGTDAKTVRLGNIIHAVHFDQDGLMPSVSSIAFPTAIQGFSGLTPYYEFKMGDTIVRGLSTASSWTLNTSAMKYSDFPLTVSVNVVINGQTLATDTVTIVGTKPGEDAYTVVLANESHTFVGDVSNAKAGSTTANVIAYRGGTQVGATIGSITGLPVGMSSTIYSNGTTAARVTFTVTTGMTSPNGVVNIPVTVNGKTFTKVFNYAIAFKGAKGDKGTDGIAGKDGVGIKATVLAYASSTSGTTTPTSGWQTTVPTVAAGNYLWTRTTWTYTDNSVENGYTVSRIGKDGNTGKDGIAGKDGVGISKTVIHYASSTSGTTAPTSGWVTTVPSVAQGSYLWTRTTWTYTDGTNETGYSAARMGTNGATGAKGDKGNPGENATARNFLLDSKPSSIIHTAAYNIADFILAEAPVSQETYSFVLKGELASTKTNFQIYNSDGSSWLAALSSIGNGLYVATFKWSYAGNYSVKVYATPVSVTAASKIEWVTMVKGSVPLTEWVPAHEDIYKYVDDVEIGGTNLYPNTTNQWNQQVFTGWQHYFQDIEIGPNNKIQTGDTVTWSAVVNPTTYNVGIMAHFTTNTGGYSQYFSNFIGPNKIEKVSGTTIVPANATKVSLALRHDSIESVNHLVKYKELKLEKGNKTTGWSPAPEDTQSQIDLKADGSATETALNEAAAKLQVLQQEVEAAATANELKDFIDKYNKDMASRDKDARESESSLSSALASISSIQTNMGDMSATWKFIDRFIKNTPQGIVVGNDSSGSYILIKEDRLSFYSNGQEVAFISQNLMEISRGAFVEQIQIAKYQFEESTTNHLTIRFVG